MSELLPCPFCGAQPEHDFFPINHYPHELYCDKCIGVVATQKKTFDEAAAAWNRRAPTIPPDVRETLRETIQRERDSLARHTNERKQYYAIYKRWPDGDDSLVTRWTDKLSRYDAALAWLDAQDGTT